MGRFTTQDPVADHFASWTPYHYVHNNPINLIDPTGMWADGYTIDISTGEIERQDDTGGEDYDVLYSKDDYEAAKASGKTNKYGNPEPENKVTVTNTDILPSLSVISEISNDAYHGEMKLSTSVVSEGSQNDIYKIFVFASNNSNVEWSAIRASVGGETQFGIGTFHNPTVAPSSSKYGFNSEQTVARIHSHPNISRKGEVGSMYGDQMNAWAYTNKGAQVPSYSYVYMPNSSNLWSINRKTGTTDFIRNLGGNYKRLYFGVLNTK